MLRMSGAVTSAPPLPYALLTWREATLPSDMEHEAQKKCMFLNYGMQELKKK
jgi:hypothetical protein